MNNNQMMPPHSADMEAAVIGSLLIDPDSIIWIEKRLLPSDFFIAHHRAIYRAIVGLHKSGKDVDLLTIPPAMNGAQPPNGGPWESTLIELMNVVPTSTSINTYANAVVEASQRRRLIAATGQIATMAYDENGDIETQLNKATELLEVARGNLGDGELLPPETYGDKYTTQLQERVERGGELAGLATGFVDVDRRLLGMESYLYILAARPGMGKSALAGGIAINAAIRGGANVACFTLEMSDIQLMNRIISVMTGIDSKRLRTGRINANEMRQVKEAVAVVSKSSLYIDDTPEITPAQIRNRAIRLNARQPLDLIIVDYIGIATADIKSNSRNNDIGSITQSFVGTAKILDCPVLALSQLNRSCEMRHDKRPMLSDLRDSGNIEQDAYSVMFLYRDGYYDDDCENPERAELLIAKNRGGETGTVFLHWAPEFVRFGNYASEEISL